MQSRFAQATHSARQNPETYTDSLYFSARKQTQDDSGFLLSDELPSVHASAADIFAGRVGAGSSVGGGDARKALESFSSAASFRCVGCICNVFHAYTVLSTCSIHEAGMDASRDAYSHYTKDHISELATECFSVGNPSGIPRGSRQED